MKVCFLVMSCQQEFFQKEFEVIKQTWAKDIIDGKYGEDVMFLGYDGWDNETTLDEENHIFHIKCEDDANNTFKKTYLTISYLQQKYNFDFIFRTNTSTYVNVDLTLKFIETLDPNTDIIWGGDAVSFYCLPAPFPNSLYLRGNSLLLSRKLIDVILNEGIFWLFQEKIDDVVIGTILNIYQTKLGNNPEDFVKCFYQGWNRSKQRILPECLSFIARVYENRENEFKILEDLNKYVKELNINYEEAIEKNKEYSNDFLIFISTNKAITYKKFKESDINEIYLESKESWDNNEFNIEKGK